MHELPIVKGIFDLCLRYAKENGVTKVLEVNLKIGEVSDLHDEWIQRYFDFLSKDTMIEGARLNIERVPLVVRCKECSESFQVNIRDGKKVECPKCRGTQFAYVSGREYSVDSMEVV